MIIACLSFPLDSLQAFHIPAARSPCIFGGPQIAYLTTLAMGYETSWLQPQMENENRKDSGKEVQKRKKATSQHLFELQDSIPFLCVPVLVLFKPSIGQRTPCNPTIRSSPQHMAVSTSHSDHPTRHSLTCLSCIRGLTETTNESSSNRNRTILIAPAGSIRKTSDHVVTSGNLRLQST